MMGKTQLDYTVEIVRMEQEPDYIPCKNKKDAIITARQEVKNPANKNAQIYVSWYRASDGQHAYLNQNGDNAITGTPWE
jgi:hypothetical protein